MANRKKTASGRRWRSAGAATALRRVEAVKAGIKAVEEDIRLRAPGGDPIAAELILEGLAAARRAASGAAGLLTMISLRR